MKSYKEFRLKEAVTINDNIWAYLNKEIDALFDKLKDTVKDMTMPRRDWLKNVHKWLYEKRYGKNETTNYSRIHFSLSEYRDINNLLDEMSSALREADGEDFGHLDGMLDFYKEKFKEIIKNLFARIRVNRKTPGAAPAAASPLETPKTATNPIETPKTATNPITSPFTPPKAADRPPEVTKPLQEPRLRDEEGEDDIPLPNTSGIPSVPKPAETPKPTVKPPVASPAAVSHDEPKPHVLPGEVAHDEREPGIDDPVDANDQHQKAHEDELIKLGLVAGMVQIQGWEEGPALDAAEELLDDVKTPEERAHLIKMGQEYLKQQELAAGGGSHEEPSVGATSPSSAAAHDLEAPKEAPAAEEDKEKAELLAKYRSGKPGQRSIRRMIKKFAPEILAGNIKHHNVEKIIDAYLAKRRAHAGLPPPGSVKEMVEYYRGLLRNPSRTVCLLDEAEKIDSIKDRVGFYKEKLRLTTR